MIQLGDITQIDGHLIEPVDVITFGSPCQDLSIAGKRAGLDGERSGLFTQAVRIIKEMREQTNGKYPTFAVWENVPGAFSSNNGGDFQCVVEEMCRIADNRVTIPRSDSGRWLTAGTVVGGNYSIAWRVMDAQYWGVPQRRRRIALVADFGGQRAGKILFESKSVRWNSPTGAKARKGIAAGTEGSTGAAGEECLTPWDVQSRRIYPDNGTWPALYAGEGGGHGYVQQCAGFSSGQSAAAGIGYESDRAPTLRAANSGSNRSPCICIAGNVVDRNASQNGSGIKDDVCFTLNTVDRHAVAILPFDTTQITSTKNGSHPHYGDPCHPIAAGAHPPAVVESYQDKTGTLSPGAHPGCYNGQDAYNDMLVTHEIYENNRHSEYKAGCGSIRASGGDTGGGGENLIVASIDCRNLSETVEKSGTLESKGQGDYSLNYINPVRNGCIVRRLTPLECERLQGYPDGWTDIPGASDSARYKALGNSIALPQWDYVLRGISKYLPSHATLGSLFDGIGGFPLTWERIQGTGTARWASEIEKFPMEVTAIRFREEKDDTAEKPAEPDSRDAQ